MNGKRTLHLTIVVTSCHGGSEYDVSIPISEILKCNPAREDTVSQEKIRIEMKKDWGYCEGMHVTEVTVKKE